MSKTGLEFSVGDHVVYPAHGVGNIQAIETQEVAGMSLEVYVITFDHEKMTLRVPTKKAKTAGLRPLAEGGTVSQALTTLKGRARVKRTMWSRRAQEYEAKINSGDPVSIAEVVRELHKAEDAEQSYSERQMYRAALERLAREVAAIERIDEAEASRRLEQVLQRITHVYLPGALGRRRSRPASDGHPPSRSGANGTEGDSGYRRREYW